MDENEVNQIFEQLEKIAESIDKPAYIQIGMGDDHIFTSNEKFEEILPDKKNIMYAGASLCLCNSMLNVEE